MSQQPKDDTQATHKHTRINTFIKFGSIFLFLLAGLALSGAINHYYYTNQVIVKKERQLTEKTHDQLAKLTQKIELVFTHSIQKIDELSHDLMDQYSTHSANKDLITRTQTHLHTDIPNVLNIRFIDTENVKLDPQAKPPIRYSELDMIHRAMKGQEVRPEASKIDTKWHLTFVSPAITDSANQVLGVFIITTGIDAIKNELDKNIINIGTLTLSQRLNNKRTVNIFTLGESTKNDLFLRSKQHMSLKALAWELSLIPSDYLYASTQVATLPIYSAMIAISFVLGGVGGIIGYYISLIFIRKRGLAPAFATAPKYHQNSADKEQTLSHIYQHTSILDMEIREEDNDLLPLTDLEDNSDLKQEAEKPAHSDDKVSRDKQNQDIPHEVFRAYDIRGIAQSQITPRFARRIGQALGSEALDYREESLIVGRDARTHSPEITDELIAGILSTGCNVINIGLVPTPLMYFACEVLPESQSGVIVTASHNAKQYNGFKIMMGGKSRSAEDILAIRTRILDDDIHQGQGTQTDFNIQEQYINTIFSDVALAGDITLVIDAGNGATGGVAPELFTELGCKVTPLYCELDGDFPNHDPDPTIAENLTDLIAKVKDVGADLGVAFDGDGDRLMVVTSTGKIIWPDQLLMLFAQDILSRHPGSDVIFDIKSTRHLGALVTRHGGRPIMWKSGHSPMKQKMQETGALLGGEYSGHIFIKDRWYGFDDGLYAAARVIEILSLHNGTLDQLIDAFDYSPCTPEIRIDIDESLKFEIIEKLTSDGNFEDGKITILDGLRADYAKGWGLVRASNTSAQLTLRFEADDNETLRQLKSLFARELQKIDSSITTNWNTP